MQPASQFDIAVVGAGPGGSSAARYLADAGMRVLLLDKARFPRYKVCGGGLVYRALQHLPKGLEEAVECSCHRAKLIHHQPDMRFTTVRSEPIVSMTMRDRLDAFLVDAACAGGAIFRDSCHLIGLCRRNSRVELETNQGKFCARFLIGADGARSSVAQLGSWGPPRLLVPALETEVEVPEKVRSSFDGSARFDFGVVDQGYAWIFPKARRLSIGVASLTPRKANLNQALARYFTILKLTDRIQSIERHGSVLSLGPRREGLYQERILLVGDAAGIADPITGEGISLAIRNGRIAAQALIETELREEQMVDAYSSGLRDLLRELRIARTMAPLLYRSSSVRAALFRLYGRRLSEAMTDIFMGRRTYSGILSEPRNYLKLLNVDR